MHTVMKRMVVLVAFAIVLAACGGDDATTTTTAPGGGGSETTTTANGDDGSATTTTDAPDTTTSTPSAPGGGTDECVVGTWSLDGPAFFASIMAAMSPEELQGASFEHVGGEYQAVANEDGTFVDRRVDWHFAVSSPAGEIDIIINHERTGEWRVEDGTMYVDLPSGEPADQQVLIDGEPFEFPGGVLPFSPPAVEWIPAAYACDGDTLTITAEGIQSTWYRTS